MHDFHDNNDKPIISGHALLCHAFNSQGQGAAQSQVLGSCLKSVVQCTIHYLPSAKPSYKLMQGISVGVGLIELLVHSCSTIDSCTTSLRNLLISNLIQKLIQIMFTKDFWFLAFYRLKVLIFFVFKLVKWVSCFKNHHHSIQCIPRIEAISFRKYFLVKLYIKCQLFIKEKVKQQIKSQ